MKQLSNLTKIMFCIVSVLLVITVALGIATAVKDGKENNENQGQGTTVTPIPDLTGGAAGTPGATGTPDGTITPDPTPTPDATETPSPTPTPANKHVVAIDPGQQKSEMKDQEPIGPGAEKTTAKMSYGATSVTTNKREYEWTLLFSKELRAELEARGYEVIMTREENDVKISNAERAQKVSETDAEIYVSIQADAASKESANGIYAQVPSRDNAYVKALYNDSKKLAKAIHTRLIAETGAYDRSVREDDSLPALNYSKIPATVLTLGFMTNNDEDTKLWTAEYRQKLIKAICDGIDEYFGE